MVIDLLNKLLKKITAADVHPETEDVINALRRLEENEDFKLFRALLRCQYAELSRTITNAAPDAVEHIRGQMYAVNAIYSISAEEYERQNSAKKELEELIASGSDQSLIY
jgi:hypothetical protein